MRSTNHRDKQNINALRTGRAKVRSGMGWLGRAYLGAGGEFVRKRKGLSASGLVLKVS